MWRVAVQIDPLDESHAIWQFCKTVMWHLATRGVVPGGMHGFFAQRCFASARRIQLRLGILYLWCGAWRTKSIGDLGCAWFESRARSSCWVDRMRNVNGLVHRRYSCLGWVSEGVHFMLKLENAMSEGVHSRKGGYVCPGPSKEFGWRTRDSMKQNYERDRLVGWTANEEFRGSTEKSHDQDYMHRFIMVMSVGKWIFPLF